MKWSITPPRKTGFYWFLFRDGARAIALVEKHHVDNWKKVKHQACAWAGPLKEPTFSGTIKSLMDKLTIT